MTNERFDSKTRETCQENIAIVRIDQNRESQPETGVKSAEQKATEIV